VSLQPCINGTQWKYSITTKQVQEGLKSPYLLESCDHGDGCECTLENITPEKANGMIFDTLCVRELTKSILKFFPEG
jgi:hypothetical protein